ncbi:MAG: hypothetical protein ACTSRK_17345 [Promethearchaeota archaeon]
MSGEEISKEGVVARNLMKRRLSDSKLNEFLLNEIGSDLAYDDLIKIRMRSSSIDSLLPTDINKSISFDEKERKAEYEKNREIIAKKMSPPTFSRSRPLNPPPSTHSPHSPEEN